MAPTLTGEIIAWDRRPQGRILDRKDTFVVVVDAEKELARVVNEHLGVAFPPRLTASILMRGGWYDYTGDRDIADISSNVTVCDTADEVRAATIDHTVDA